MFKLKASDRVVFGRNVTLTAGIIYSLSRSMYYATLDPSKASLAQDVITADGRLLGMWAGVWAFAAACCVADMVNRHTRYGLSLVVGLAFAWGIAYAIMWAITGDAALLSSAVGWITPAGLVFGFLIKVTALQDMLRDKATTGGD